MESLVKYLASISATPIADRFAQLAQDMRMTDAEIAAEDRLAQERKWEYQQECIDDARAEGDE